MDYLLFALICLIWSASFILMKVAYAAFGPISIGAGRALGGAAALWLICRVLRRPLRGTLSRRDLALLVGLVLLGMVYPWFMQPYLIGRNDNSAFFGMTIALVPLVTMLASVPLLGVYPRPRQVVGVGIGLACFSLLFGVGRQIGVPMLDIVLALTVPTAYACTNTLIKRRFAHVQPVELTVAMLTMAGVVMLPAAALAEPNPVGRAGFGWAAAALAVLGVLGTGVTMLMFYHLVRSRGPLFPGMSSYLIPIGALLWGRADREPITLLQVASLGGILLGVALVQWPARRQRTAAADDPARQRGESDDSRTAHADK